MNESGSNPSLVFSFIKNFNFSLFSDFISVKLSRLALLSSFLSELENYPSTILSQKKTNAATVNRTQNSRRCFHHFFFCTCDALAGNPKSTLKLIAQSKGP